MVAEQYDFSGRSCAALVWEVSNMNFLESNFGIKVSNKCIIHEGWASGMLLQTKLLWDRKKKGN